MAQILVRNLDDEVAARLKRKAAEKNRSLGADVRALLTEAARPSLAEIVAAADAIRARTKRGDGDVVDLIREGREEQDRKWERIWRDQR